jgi:hypothetical protein
MSGDSSESCCAGEIGKEDEVKNGIYGLKSNTWIATLSEIENVECARAV